MGRSQDDRAAELDEIAATARALRKRPSRRLWIVALLVALACTAGLAYALIVDWDAEPDRRVLPSEARGGGSGFGLGLALGIGAGIAIGSVIALRKRS